MIQTNPIPSDERIVDVMLQLARAKKTQRLIVAGSNCPEVYPELHRLGYPHITTTRTTRIPCGQHDVALVASGHDSVDALEATLHGLVHFLSAGGVLVIWIGSQERMPDRKLRLALNRLGFRIESGTVCESGVAFAARRLESSPVAKAA